jgi:hypothetical protein
METTTPGGMVGSDTAAVVSFTGPEQATLSDAALSTGAGTPNLSVGGGVEPTVPEAVGVALVTADCA